MGLDAVEIVMSVEDEFNIKIQDDDYCKCRTVGDLALLVQNKLGIAEQPTCTSPFVFCEFRRALIELFGVPRQAIRLNSRINELIPTKLRRHHWQTLQQQLDWRLPELEFLGGSASELSSYGDVCFCSALALTLIAVFVPGFWVLVAILVGFAILSKSAWVCESFSYGIPRRCATVRDTVLTIQAWNQIRRRGDSPSNVSQNIYLRIRGIVSDCLNIPAEEIQPNHRFIEDLKCG